MNNVLYSILQFLQLIWKFKNYSTKSKTVIYKKPMQGKLLHIKTGKKNNVHQNLPSG